MPKVYFILLAIFTTATICPDSYAEPQVANQVYTYEEAARDSLKPMGYAAATSLAAHTLRRQDNKAPLQIGHLYHPVLSHRLDKKQIARIAEDYLANPIHKDRILELTLVNNEGKQKVFRFKPPFDKAGGLTGELTSLAATEDFSIVEASSKTEVDKSVRLLKRVNDHAFNEHQVEAIVKSYSHNHDRALFYLELRDPRGITISRAIPVSTREQLGKDLRALSRSGTFTITKGSFFPAGGLMARRALGAVQWGGVYTMAQSIVELVYNGSIVTFSNESVICGPGSLANVNCETRTLPKKIISGNWANLQAESTPYNQTSEASGAR